MNKIIIMLMAAISVFAIVQQTEAYTPEQLQAGITQSANAGGGLASLWENSIGSANIQITLSNGTVVNVIVFDNGTAILG